MTWTPATSITPIPTNTYWTSVSISSTGQYGAACTGNGSDGQIYYSADYGHTWNSFDLLLQGYWAYVCISNTENIALACIYEGANNYIYYSNDYGQTWTIATFASGGYAIGNWRSVSLSNSGQYAVASYYSGHIYWSNDYGKTWAQSNSPFGFSYQWQNASISGNGQYALGCITASNGQIYRCIATN
jgi:photosystem II stability/assembly factor-like uncharacterized protein